MELSFTARNVLVGASLLGIVGGALGCFALLRRQSLLGDALAHAALPGVCMAFWLTGSKSPPVLFAGALVAGLLGAFVILGVVRGSRIKEDSAIGIVLSVFFAIGIVLLTYLQKLPLGNQSGLDKFLFGQAATLLPRDVQWMAVISILVLVVLALFFKELKLLSFDPEFGKTLGLPMRAVELGLTILLVVVVVVGLQTVGVVLMVATLITPAAAARQWTESLGWMVVLAGLIGGLSGAGGAFASSMISNLPTGPVIVVSSSVILAISLAVAPSRGLAWAWIERRRTNRRIRRENLLKDLYRYGEAQQDWSRYASLALVMGFRGQSAPALVRLVKGLRDHGLVERSGDDLRLTQTGLVRATDVVRKHRLWELYLTRKLELPSDHVHRDAEEMEHVLSDSALERLEQVLGHPEVDPHGRPIPARRTA